MENKGKIRYEIARNIIKKMLNAGLITEEEFEKIDGLNKAKFLCKTA